MYCEGDTYLDLTALVDQRMHIYTKVHSIRWRNHNHCKVFTQSWHC